ncbi:MAG: hypothetical protein AAB400_02145 [Patescibacteria group bacterium]
MNTTKNRLIASLKYIVGVGIGLSTILIGSFLYSTPVDAQQYCNASAEEFASSGSITCGNIRWRLHPQDAARLATKVTTPKTPVADMQLAFDMRPYLQKYQLAYEIIKDFTGYERPEHELIIEERCAPGASGACPNGRLIQDVPMYAIGNAVYIRNDFFETTFPFIAQDPRAPLSADILRQMGRVFTPSQGGTADGYIWDSALPDSFAEIQGLYGVVLYSQVNNVMEKFYSDEWCAKQGKGRLCFDFFTTLDQYATIKYDKALQEYISRKDNFDTLFAIPFSTLNVPSSSLTIPVGTTIVPSSNLPTVQRSEIFNAMIAQTAREANNQKMLFSYYDGLRKTFRAYNTYPYVVEQPASWHQDPTVLTLDLKYQKANYFVYLLSSFSRIDFSQSFLKWNFPLVKETKDIILTNVNEASDEPRIPVLGKRILSRSFAKLTLASAPRNLRVADPKLTSSLILSWDEPVNVAFISFNVYRTDTDRGVSTLIAKNVKGNNYTDTALNGGRTYYYDIAASDANGFESSITVREGKQPSPPIEIKPYEQVFYFYSYGPAKIEETYAEVNWGTTKIASAKIMYAPQEGGPYILLEDNDKKFGGQFKLHGLKPSTTYYYKVAAVDNAGLILEQKGTFATLAQKITTVPATHIASLGYFPISPAPAHQDILIKNTSGIPEPSGVYVSETGTGNSVKISWKNSGNKKLLTRIYRSTVPYTKGISVAEFKNTTTRWYDNNVEPFTPYTYTLVNVAKDSGFESEGFPWTLTISPAPALGPQNIRVISQGYSNLVQWNIPSYFTSAKSVSVYRSLAKGQLGRQVASGLPLNQKSFLDNPPMQNETWHYTVHIVTKLAVESTNNDQYIPIVIRQLAKR